MAMIDPNRLCPNCLQEMPTKGGRCPVCGYTEQTQEVSPRCMPPYTILAGRYFVGTVLGEGGFGITYKGWDLQNNTKVAIKEYFPAGLVTRDTSHGGANTVQSISGQMRTHYQAGLQKYENEARCLMDLKGTAGIVNILNFFHENATAYIIMEFIEGMTLRDYLSLNGGSLSEQKVLEMFRPLMYSLDAVHRAGIVHRDISPDNILVQPDGGLKLIDFGAARQSTGSATQSMTVILKHGYAPEEQYRSRSKQGPFTDVYAISATLYKVLTGITPVDSMSRLFEDELTPLEQLPHRISPKTCGAVKKGMGIRAEDRFRTMSELAAALYDKEVTVEPTLAMPVVKRKHSGRMLMLIGAAALLCVLIVGSISLLVGPGQNDSELLASAAQLNVPELSGKTEEDARALLTSLGVAVEVEYAAADGAHAGRVLSWSMTSPESVRLVVGELTSFIFEENEDGLTITGYSGEDVVLQFPQTINGIQVTEIGEYAMMEDGMEMNGIEQISLPDGLLRIGEGAFSGCSYLKSLKLPDTMQQIGMGAFWGCSAVDTVNMPKDLKRVEKSAFQYCYNLPEIILPEGCESIGEEAFCGCTAVKRVVIPDSVTDIGSGAFGGCPFAELQVVAGSAGEEHAKQGNIPWKLQTE